ncbi:uncharacterized protein LOC129593931 [Paramacrobiotus metropolitanus]|uniref:uncharacterized protein LOC129593931 n=1 Tax=Paramacrobiotus metropolitanus TaxID=2943436 RepID=UPI002445A5B5|nr:uncharacterized protein LOC129593931 [Paramacrobiotus metropolitanus]
MFACPPCRRRIRLMISVCLRPTRSWCLALLLQLHLSAGCSPGSPSTNLNDMVAEAMLNNRQDDRIILTRLPTTHDVTDSVVYRPRLGEDAAFSCSVPAGIDWRSVSWLHQDRTAPSSRRANRWRCPWKTPRDRPTTSATSITPSSFRFSMSACAPAGPCSASPLVPRYTPYTRVLQRFVLLPLITRHSDVFAPATPYVTATEGERVTVLCSIRLPLPESIYMGLHNHLMWRHNGHIVQGPPEAPYGPLMPTWGLAQWRPRDAKTEGTDPPNSPGQLLGFAGHIKAVTLADQGHIQCLFRPHQGIHEWVVQTTTLLVFAKNITQYL